MTERHRFSLWQDGIEVASVDAPDLASAQREIMHYAMMYAQDGPCEIRGKNIKLFTLGERGPCPRCGYHGHTASQCTCPDSEVARKRAPSKEG